MATRLTLDQKSSGSKPDEAASAKASAAKGGKIQNASAAKGDRIQKASAAKGGKKQKAI